MRKTENASKLDELLEAVKRLRRSHVRQFVEARIREFKALSKKPSSELFKELCFCILTANFNAERSIRIQEAIGDGFLTLPESELAERLRSLGHRYPHARARYIVEARRYAYALRRLVEKLGSGSAVREWLVENIRGVGYKEASHFLRNIGFTDVAIVDFHIVDLLTRYGVVSRPKTLTRKRYLAIEQLLREMAERLGLNLAELDLYLWYLETGKVLK